MRLFQPCSLAIRHNLFVPPPTKDILWLRATTPAPTIPIENRKYMNRFLSLFAFSCFSPPIELFVKFHIQFSFHFYGSFSKFFLSLAWMRIVKPVGLTFSIYFHLGIIPSLKMPTLTFRLVNFIVYLPLKLLFAWILLRFRSCSCLTFAACFAAASSSGAYSSNFSKSFAAPSLTVADFSFFFSSLP